MYREIELRVLNELGLHARPATEFVRCALKFKATTLTIRRDAARFSCTSILEVLTANLDQGATFVLEADGPQAEDALAEFAAMLVRFKEEEDEGRR